MSHYFLMSIVCLYLLIEIRIQKNKGMIFEAAIKIHVKFSMKKRKICYKDLFSIIGGHKILLFEVKCQFSFFPLCLLHVIFSFIESL